MMRLITHPRGTTRGICRALFFAAAGAGLTLGCAGPRVIVSEVQDPFADRLASAVDASNLLSPGEVVEVRVVGQPDLSGTFVVDDEGRLPLPLLGFVTAGGENLETLAGLIETALSGNYLDAPEVTVSRSAKPAAD